MQPKPPGADRGAPSEPADVVAHVASSSLRACRSEGVGPSGQAERRRRPFHFRFAEILPNLAQPFDRMVSGGAVTPSRDGCPSAGKRAITRRRRRNTLTAWQDQSAP
ncbi:hypothetical protein SBD_1944 [Streptomyces bottropensis ATCC 25435]|uniref:Uncharacterized protein n=1 Tax=Streptomyces bottropensis ATCC 25435 TaxID=1054862 RepID=M3FUH0_9ACTN|nr:hypothetical protein SBD_1944 [Streptomyces bottropensis ATCC 25435]